MSVEQSQITDLLHRWSAGDKDALNRLIPIVYDRLRALAHQRLRDAPEERSLNTTGLIHEAYLKLVDSPDPSFRSREHFLALASRVMRNVLVEHARSRVTVKRGGGIAPLELREDAWITGVDLDRVTELDEALKKLESLDPRQSQIIEQRFFGGLSLEEVASVLNVSLATVKRELRSARAWLAAELRAGNEA